jgi:hypothetical protein
MVSRWPTLVHCNQTAVGVTVVCSVSYTSSRERKSMSAVEEYNSYVLVMHLCVCGVQCL